MEIPILFFYTIHGTECGMCKEMLLRKGFSIKKVFSEAPLLLHELGETGKL